MEQKVLTDRTVSNNLPDIIIRKNTQGTYMSIDGANPVDRNVINKEAEKTLKYKDLTIEFQHMCNVKAKLIPIKQGRIEPPHYHPNET